MRVLFVTNLWPDEERPWHGTFVHTQALSLRQLGIEVDVLPIRGWASKRAYFTAAGRVLRMNARRPADVVHAHYGHSAAVARLQVRAPLVISYCGDDLLGTPDAAGRRMTRHSTVLARAFAQLSRLSAATITKSEEMERRLPRGARARNHVIPNGVDLDAFAPVPRDRARAQLGWAPDEPVVLFVGNPEIPRKNHALAASACELAARSAPGLRLQVAWGISPDEMSIWMSAADVLLTASISEGSQNVVKEAMACELPVVATPAGDVTERLAGVPGCHVAPADPQALAAAVLAALAHGRSPEARTAVSSVSLERIAERVAEVYRKVV